MIIWCGKYAYVYILKNTWYTSAANFLNTFKGLILTFGAWHANKTLCRWESWKVACWKICFASEHIVCTNCTAFKFPLHPIGVGDGMSVGTGNSLALEQQNRLNHLRFDGTLETSFLKGLVGSEIIWVMAVMVEATWQYPYTLTSPSSCSLAPGPHRGRRHWRCWLEFYTLLNCQIVWCKQGIQTLVDDLP